MRRALALIDGEHYASVVRDALADLPYDFLAACLVGGSEKLRPHADYGVRVGADLDALLVEYEPDVVVDLSDEPVLGPAQRFRLASRVLARGIAYEGADFRFEPPVFEPFEPPSLAVIGTGKRVGKTALTVHAARLLSRERELVVVAMGRGGPGQPELVETPPSVEDLLQLSRSGRHAASDYLEIAALAGVRTVGCRRCGGGLAGAVASSNVIAGAELAREHCPELVLFDGSGAALPPVAVGKRLLVTSAAQPPELVAGYLNAYRILISDLVIVTASEEGSRHQEVARAVAEVKDVPVVATVLRPRPVRPIEGRRVAYFTAAPRAASELLARHLREAYGADLSAVSCNLSRRTELARELEEVDAEVYVVELKGAAVDLVVERATERGSEVVFVANDLVPLPGQPDLDAALEALAAAAEPVGT